MNMLFVLSLLVQGPQTPTLCYEVFVRSFYDSNGDGIGDLRGLTQKLDYIAGLGADCVWLMPVAESPSYHGYDVTDYYRVERDYGTNEDFKAFAAAAHQHHIRVLVDLVLNHTSSEHPWFQEALRDTASPHRNWYRWSTTPGNNWHKSPVRDEYYFGLFWSGMPDLNYENPAVLEEMKRVARFWLDSMHVDGFRFDLGTILARDLKPYRDELIISTKAGYLMWPGPYGEWGSRKYLIASLDQSLQRMGLDYVDIFYSHRLDPDTPLEETMSALDQVVRQGKALYVGISSYSPDATRRGGSCSPSPPSGTPRASARDSASRGHPPRPAVRAAPARAAPGRPAGSGLGSSRPPRSRDAGTADPREAIAAGDPRVGSLLIIAETAGRD